MVSVSKLLQVMSCLVHSPQPRFTQIHAHTLLKAIINIPLDQRSRVDSLNMMRIVAHCPHASTLFAQHLQLSEKILITFFVERATEEAERDEALHQVIRVVSINQEISTSLLLTMIRKLSRARRESSPLGLSTAAVQNDALVEELLRRVVSRMPKTGEEIREDEGGAVMTQKAMHKRKGRNFERPELHFLASTLRHVTTSRTTRLKGNVMGAGSVASPLPAHIVDPVVQCVETLPVFRQDKTQPRDDDWILMAHLIGCCDTRLHSVGKRLWETKAYHYNPMDINFGADFFLPSWLAGFIYALRGTAKYDAMKLWIDILTDPQALLKLQDKMLRMLLLDVTICLQLCSEDNFRERLLAGGFCILNAMEASPILSTTTHNALRSRLSFTRSFPPLETPVELAKSLLQVKTLLAANNELESGLIREVAEFLRHVQKNLRDDEKTLTLVMKLLAEHILRMLTLPSLDGDHIAAVLSALLTFNLALRELQEKDSLEKEEADLKDLFIKISMKSLHHHGLQYDSFLVVLLLQMMELLGFASDTQCTTAVRELVLVALRSLLNKAQEVNSHAAQHCFDLTLRAVRFHVVDEEVLTAVSIALRHAADVAVLRNIGWDQRALTVERGSIVYRELARLFSSSKEARRLAKRILNITALITSEKLAPRSAESQYEVQGQSWEWRYRRRCSLHMWTLALRASMSPIPRTPIDRYLTPMFRFASKHWIAEGLTNKRGAVHNVDEGLSREFLDNMLLMLHLVVVSAFTDKTAFYANLRRNKLIITTACEMLKKNSDFLSPCVWFSAQRTLSSLPTLFPAQCTPLQLSVLQAALKHTLRNAQACGNRGTWHLTEQQKMVKQATEDDVILNPWRIGDMFSCADIIDDQELRLYLISLIVEQVEMFDTEAEAKAEDESSPLSEDEKARLVCLRKVLTTLRRGSVLYY